MGTQPPRAHDGIADWYDEVFVDYGDLEDPLSSACLLAAALGRGECLCLDVACGGGLHHAALASTGRRIAGLDISMDQLRGHLPAGLGGATPRVRNRSALPG